MTDIIITDIRPSTTGVARAADLTATIDGAEVQYTLAAGQWQPGSEVTEWVTLGDHVDCWIRDASRVPADLVGELAALGEVALNEASPELYDAILAVRDANDES